MFVKRVLFWEGRVPRGSRRMVACVAPAAHAKSEQSCSSAAGGGVAPAEWQSFGGGLAMNESSSRSQVAPLGVPKSLTVPKPERQLYREAAGEGGEYDLYQHGRKRAKVHDGVASPVLQVSMVEWMWGGMYGV